MIPKIKGFSHIFWSRLLDRLKGPKYSISYLFVNDSIHFFINAWNRRILFLLFPFSLLPNYWFTGGNCKSLRSIFFFWLGLFSNGRLDWYSCLTSFLEQLGKLNNAKILQMGPMLMRHVVNADFNKLLFFKLPITVKSSVSELSNEVKEFFGGLLLGVVKSKNGNFFFSMKIPWKKTFNHVIPCGNGTWLESGIPCVCTIGKGF